MILLALMLAAAVPDCAQDLTQADMNRCAAERAARADIALNGAWKRLAAATRGQKAPLLDAQRKWLAFRDAQCGAEAGAYEGGSMQPMVRVGCIADLTEERTKRLRALAQDAAR